ncbi:hypothetical protein D9758_012948 [Tetrapyrgos nigripes]|uniref:F-box domain-containing protein n=1 Tax=Tetrapyrgos nigripes TaxID=182062 RepID=A0A8H5FNQ0_9AGAR|nr:hypothetical protein D9758_012948 [Tetrapyrgos nigripes]
MLQETMHPLLQVTELLRIIFEHLEKEDLVRCALVCKSWSEVALDVVWFAVKDMGALANLLSPVKVTVLEDYDDMDAVVPRFVYNFDPNPTTRDWSRFETKYSSRVRHLHFLGALVNARAMEYHDFASLLGVIQRVRSSSPLLPNLRSLEWYSKGDLCTLVDGVTFMHDTVNHCHMQYDCYDVARTTDVSFFIEAIHMRMPLLTSLHIHTAPAQELVSPLASIFENLPHLTRVVVPAFKDIAPLLSSLSKSSKLEELQFLYCNSDPRVAVARTGSPLQRDAFAALAKLVLYGFSYSTAVCPLLSRNSLAGLRSLTLGTIEVEKLKAVQFVLRLLPSFAPNLVEFVLGCPEAPEPDEDAICESIPFDAFRPILECTKMEKFVWCLHNPLSLTDSDVEKITSTWVDLKVLKLSSMLPLHRIQHPFNKPTLRALSILTRRCLGLKDVSLYLDTTMFLEFESVSDTLPAMTTKFADLEILDVGFSDIVPRHMSYTAMSLAQVCSPQCLLSWSPADEATSSRWKMVQVMFLLFSDIFRLEAAVCNRDDQIVLLKEQNRSLRHMLSQGNT